MNPYKNGTARTIKSQYHKTSVANFVSETTFGATGVIRKYEHKKS